MSSSPWTENDFETIIKMEKLVDWPLPLPQESETNKNYLLVRFDLMDPNHVVIPGVFGTVRMRLENGTQGCNESYSLFVVTKERAHRVFAIDVMPKWRISHRNGKHSIKGPHINYIDETRKCSAKFDCETEKRIAWLRRFLRHIHTKPRYGKHSQYDLFGVLPW